MTRRGRERFPTVRATSGYPAVVSRIRSRLVASLLVAASLGAVVAPGAGIAAAPTPAPGTAAMSDPFYPTLGNRGYDVQAYDLDLIWHAPDRTHPQGWLAGRAGIDLVVGDQPLGWLSLDLARASTDVESITVDGVPAAVGSDGFGRKLVVTPVVTLAAMTPAHLAVTWTATPQGVHRLGEERALDVGGAAVDSATRAVGRGFLSDGAGGFFLAAQPNGAHTLFPSNDYPTDQALVTVRLTAPAGMQGVATGTRTSQTANADGTTTTTWHSDAPVPTHVLAIGVGRTTMLEDDPVGGPHLRSVVPTDLAALAPVRLAWLVDALHWLESAIGRPYPYRSLGLQVVPARVTDAILEGQTLVLLGAQWLAPWVSDCEWRSILVHELVHQWFGDSVSVARWDQKWLSEGHATFYEQLWLAQAGCSGDLDTTMQRTYADAQRIRDAGGPPDRPRGPRFAYGPVIYDQGALALYALRSRIGTAAFQRVETTFLDRFAGRAATTDDYIAIAAEVAGPAIVPFLDAWLRADVVPPMPGHPAWSPTGILPAQRGPAREQPTEHEEDADGDTDAA